MREGMQVKTVATDVLEIAYLEYGPPGGWPCIMGHGFPYDVHAYAEAAPLIAQAGARVLVPWLRGYGPTRFRSAATLRSGEQAALGADMLAFMDALGIGRAILGGYDWGGRAACVVAAVYPERVVGLVSGNSYNIQNIARCMEPASAAGGRALVPVSLSQRARPLCARAQPARLRPPALVDVVAEMGL
jgi:pimeloyl-ACP methyl ester carboxylesterase